MRTPIWSEAGRQARLPSAPGLVPVVLTVCVGLAVSVALFVGGRRMDWNEMREEFLWESKERFLAIERRS